MATLTNEVRDLLNGIKGVSPFKIQEAGIYELQFVDYDLRFADKDSPTDGDNPYRDSQLTIVTYWKEYDGIRSHTEKHSMFGYYSDYSFEWKDEYTPVHDTTYKEMKTTRKAFAKLSDDRKKALVFIVPPHTGKIANKYPCHRETMARVVHPRNTAITQRGMEALIGAMSSFIDGEHANLDLLELQKAKAKDGNPLTMQVNIIERTKEHGSIFEIKDWMKPIQLES